MPDLPACRTLKLLSSVPTVQPESTLPSLQLLRSRRAAWAAVAVLMTLIAVLLYANLAGPDQELEHPVPHADDVHDPQFRRTMDQLLGRPIVPGKPALQSMNMAFRSIREAHSGGTRFSTSIKSAMIRSWKA